MKEVVKYVGIDLDSGFKGGFYLQNSIFRKIDFFFFYLQFLLVRSYIGFSSSQVLMGQYGGQFGKIFYFNSLDSDQLIDYSINKINKLLVFFKYGNYVGYMIQVVMYYSFIGFQKFVQNLFNILFMVFYSNMYVEIDLDCEQFIDYSRRFVESYEDSDGDQFYDMRYEDNCVDCKFDIVRRINDRLEFLLGYNDDQVKIFCIEGIFRNYLFIVNLLIDFSKGEKEDIYKEYIDEEEEEEEEEEEGDYQYEEDSGFIEKRSGSGSQSIN